MEFYKQCLGIDISKSKFDCCLSLIDKTSAIKVIGSKVFTNNVQGFVKLMEWVSLKSISHLKINVVLEATGVYYENLAYYLSENSPYRVSVLLPMRAKFYFKSLSIKTKTDKVDARMLSQLGLERNVPSWEPMTLKMKEIKSLSREYRENKKEINRLKNQLHAKEHSYRCSPQIIKRLKQRITLVEEHCLAIELELKMIVREEQFLSDKIEKITSIPGVGFISAIAIVAETNGFILIKNSKQLASYAGLDVMHNNSGIKTGKSRISKRGNKFIRQALYMPALSASRHVNHLNQFYQRVNDRNSCKKIGLIGVARKLLVLVYTLWKNDEYYRVIT